VKYSAVRRLAKLRYPTALGLVVGEHAYEPFHEGIGQIFLPNAQVSSRCRGTVLPSRRMGLK
jgi:hypothetical protein